MPFESQAQWNWAFATGQPWARDWAKHTPGGKRKYALLKRRASAKRYKADVEARGNAPGRRWSAGRGEVITGNLGRDASGRFVNVGSGSRAVSSAVETIARAQRQNTKKPKKPKKQTLTAEQRAQQRQQERARAGESGMQELGYSAEQYAALATIRGNPQPVGESVDQSTQSLIDSGFAEIVGGNVVTTALGKKVLSSVESGSPGDAQEAIIRDQEKRQERADKRQDKIDSLEEKIAGIEGKLDSLKPRSRAVAERRLTRYRAKLAELQTSEKSAVPEPAPEPTPTRRKSAAGYTPPADVRAAAARGLELRREFNRGGTAVGVARARDLSNGKSISTQTIRRMVSYFARHAVDKRPDWSNPSDPTPGYIAWMLWGGDAGRRWANAMNKRMSTREKHLPGQHDQRSHGRNTPRRQAYRAAYRKARSEGVSPEEARAIARGVSREVFRKELEQRRAERDARRAEREANRKVKPKPPIVQPEKISTVEPEVSAIPSVLDGSFKSLTPDEQAEVAINHFQNAPGYIELVREEKRLKDERNRIVSEFNKQQKQKTVNPADAISRETAESIIKQHADAVKRLNDRETELFHQVLEQLQVDNPTTVSVSYKGKMTKSVRARVERTMQLVSGMFPQTSQRGDIQIELRNSETRGRFRGAAKPSVGAQTQYQVSSFRDPTTGQWTSIRTPITIPAKPDRVTGEIKGNASDSRLMIHESLHVFQHSTQALRDPCHDFAVQRTQGENAQYLSVLMNNAGYGQETAYKDAVDNPYTLKTYAGNYGWDRGFYDSSYATPFMEVLTMGFESMADPDIQDRGPLIAALTAIKAAQQK